MKKYRIIFFSKESIGGTGVILSQLSLINKSKFRHIFYLYKSKHKSAQIKHYQYLNKYYPEDKHLSFIKLFLFGKILFLTLKAIINNKPKIAVSCDFYSSVILLLIKRFSPKVKVVCLVNSNIEAIVKEKRGTLYQDILFLLLKKLYSFPDRIIYLSSGLAKNTEKFLDLPKYQKEVIYPGIRFKRQSKKINIDKHLHLKKMKNDQNIRIVSVGRLDSQKDQFTILKAFADLNSNSFSLYLIGDGPLKEELIAYKIKRDLKQVFFLGWINNVYPYLKSADIFISSSLYEGLCISVLEAMEAGLPIISTNTPFGPRELLDDGRYGFLVPMKGHREMATIIKELSRNRHMKEKFAKLAFKRSLEFNQNTTIRKYNDLFSKLVRSR